MDCCQEEWARRLSSFAPSPLKCPLCVYLLQTCQEFVANGFAASACFAADPAVFVHVHVPFIFIPAGFMGSARVKDSFGDVGVVTGRAGKDISLSGPAIGPPVKQASSLPR